MKRELEAYGKENMFDKRAKFALELYSGTKNTKFQLLVQIYPQTIIKRPQRVWVTIHSVYFNDSLGANLDRNINLVFLAPEANLTFQPYIFKQEYWRTLVQPQIISNYLDMRPTQISSFKKKVSCTSRNFEQGQQAKTKAGSFIKNT